VSSHVIDLETIKAIPGTYALILHLSNKLGQIEIGKLGHFAFDAGFYVYVGSAFGPGGLKARLRRHLRTDKPLHWHIDYLRPHAELVEMWIFENPENQECRWGATLSNMKGASIPVTGMGSSDCPCKSHLVYFPTKPFLTAFQERSGIPVVQVLPRHNSHH